MAGLLKWIGRSVDDLVKLGYPEEVAKRISSGELPMDEASRAARRDAFGEKMYRGLGQAYQEGKGTNATTWATPDPTFASGYAIENAEKLIDPAANVIPVRVKSENPLDLGFRTSFTEVKPDNIANRVGTRIQEAFAEGKITREEAIKADDAIWDWYENLHDLDKQAFRPVFSYWNKDKGFVDALKKAGFDSIKDAEVSAGSWGSLSDTPDVKTLGVLDDANIRSEYAAFDPEYTGPNILGSRMAPTAVAGLLGAAALTESQDAEAGVWGKPVSEVLAAIKRGDNFLYHSGNAKNAEDIARFGLEPQYGEWTREIFDGDPDALDSLPAATWFSERPDWVTALAARSGGVPIPSADAETVRKHGLLAIVNPEGDFHSPSDFYRMPDYESQAMDGQYTPVTDLTGEKMRLYDTPLYDYDSGYVHGLEPNDIVTTEAIEPETVLTGDDLVEFMKEAYPNLIKSGRLPSTASLFNAIAADNQSMLLDSYMSQLGADKKPDIYNYGKTFPIKRNKVTGEYSYATTGILEEMLRGLLDIGESRKSGVITNPNSILDVLL